MKKGNAPYIFLGLLCVIIVFVGGLRYGTKVEQANKTIHYLLSLTPTKPISTPPEAPISYNTYSHTLCGVEFLYPSSLTLINESSDSAKLGKKGSETVFFSCAKNVSLDQIIDNSNVATVSFQIGTRKIDGYEIIPAQPIKVAFEIRNPISGKLLLFRVEKSLLPLLTSTFKFK